MAGISHHASCRQQFQRKLLRLRTVPQGPHAGDGQENEGQRAGAAVHRRRKHAGCQRGRLGPELQPQHQPQPQPRDLAHRCDPNPPSSLAPAPPVQPQPPIAPPLSPPAFRARAVHPGATVAAESRSRSRSHSGSRSRSRSRSRSPTPDDSNSAGVDTEVGAATLVLPSAETARRRVD